MGSPFGWQLLLDLYDCDNQKIRSRDEIVRFAVELCDRLGMKRFGEPLVEHFGYERAETAGYSLVQLIETSAIVGHFSELSRAAYLDIFSCKEYDADAVTEFAKEFFCAGRVVERLVERT
jgi:S-adenosylmethionine/arginine decarboxylase-like enzyme